MLYIFYCAATPQAAPHLVSVIQFKKTQVGFETFYQQSIVLVSFFSIERFYSNLTKYSLSFIIS